MCSVHGDDSTTAAAKRDFDMNYELRKGGRIGPGKSAEKEGRALNRVVRRTDGGLEYEADPGQAEKLIELIGLSGDSIRSTVTPGLECILNRMSTNPIG